MKHYFSLYFVSYHWLGENFATKIGKTLNKSSCLAREKITRDFRMEHKLCSSLYLSMPQLIAYDIYMALKEEFTSALPIKRKVIHSACREIIKLPASGWDVNQFRLMALRPSHSANMFIVYGTNFDVVNITQKQVERCTMHLYKGSNLIKKLDDLTHHQFSYGQLVQVDGETRCYWGVMTLLERKKRKLWRYKPNQIRDTENNFFK